VSEMTAPSLQDQLCEAAGIVRDKSFNRPAIAQLLVSARDRIDAHEDALDITRRVLDAARARIAELEQDSINLAALTGELETRGAIEASLRERVDNLDKRIAELSTITAHEVKIAAAAERLATAAEKWAAPLDLTIPHPDVVAALRATELREASAQYRHISRTLLEAPRG
jgi:hypothetical protein